MKTPELEYQGLWWLPGKEEKRLSGTLSFDRQPGRALLRLSGSLSDGKDLLSGKTVPLIMGFTSCGKEVTLYRCATTGGKLSFPGFPTEEYDAQRVFINIGFAKEEDIKFSSVSVLFSNSSEWVGTSGMQFEVPADPSLNITLRYAPRKIAEVKIGDGWQLEIGHKANVQPPQHHLDRTEAGIKESTVFKIKPSKEESFDWFLQKIRLLSNFLTLGVGTPVFSLEVKAYSEKATLMVSGEKKYEEISIFFLMADPPKILKNQIWNKMFFAFGHIAPHFNSMIQNWFEKSELLDPVYDLYFGTLYNSSMYIQHEFLSLIQALESYHRRVFGGKYLEDDPYRPILNTLTSAIPAAIESDFKESLKSRLKYGNEFSLRKRLKKILDIHKELVGTLISNHDKFIAQVVDTRNYLTHYTKELEPKACNGIELYYLGQRIKFLIEICLLSELGLPKEAIMKRIAEDRRYSHIKAS